jgi:hypothetical protein
MRVTIFVTCLLLSEVVSLPNSQEQMPDSCFPARTDYGIVFVNSAFQYYKDGYNEGLHHGTGKFADGQPSLNQFGDAASTAVLKICPLDELVKPSSARAYLTLVQLSFTDESKVLEKSDRDPRVTSLVLIYLEQKEIAEPKLLKIIAQVKRCTKDFSCASRAPASEK